MRDDERAKASNGVDKMSKSDLEAAVIAQDALIKELVEALEMADAKMSGANMDIGFLEKRVRSAIAKAKAAQ